MGIIVGVFLMLGLTRMADNGLSPKICALIYTIARIVLILAIGTLIQDTDMISLVIIGIVSFLLAWGYFWLLGRFTGIIWWLIFIIGAFVLFI